MNLMKLLVPDARLIYLVCFKRIVGGFRVGVSRLQLSQMLTAALSG